MANWQIFFLHSIFFYHPSRQLKYSLPSSAPPKLQEAGLKKKNHTQTPNSGGQERRGERDEVGAHTHTVAPSITID